MKTVGGAVIADFKLCMQTFFIFTVGCCELIWSKFQTTAVLFCFFTPNSLLKVHIWTVWLTFSHVQAFFGICWMIFVWLTVFWEYILLCWKSYRFVGRRNAPCLCFCFFIHSIIWPVVFPELTLGSHKLQNIKYIFKECCKIKWDVLTHTQFHWQKHKAFFLRLKGTHITVCWLMCWSSQKSTVLSFCYVPVQQRK